MKQQQNNVLKILYDFFKSVKLTVVLLIIIIVFTTIATLIPQNQSPIFYSKKFGSLLSTIILTLDMDNYYKSIIFLFPLFIFSINLLVCTISRLIKQIKIKPFAKKRFGPDIIHLGFIILLVGGFITLFNRWESFTYMKEGNTVSLPDGYELYLEKFEFEKYEDNSPKNWVSTVQVKKGDSIIKTKKIMVNDPLNFQGISILQSGYKENHNVVVLTNQKGDEVEFLANQVIYEDDEIVLVYVGNEKVDFGDGIKTYAVFQSWKENNLQKEYHFKQNDEIGDSTISDIYSTTTTGLSFVKDPGYLPVLISFLIIIVGLTITFIQKIGDAK